jgi:hypothetical protein
MLLRIFSTCCLLVRDCNSGSGSRAQSVRYEAHPTPRLALPPLELPVGKSCKNLPSILWQAILKIDANRYCTHQRRPNRIPRSPKAHLTSRSVQLPLRTGPPAQTPLNVPAALPAMRRQLALVPVGVHLHDLCCGETYPYSSDRPASETRVVPDPAGQPARAFLLQDIVATRSVPHPGKPARGKGASRLCFSFPGM